nr:gibberellin 3-beta-dioxygenase 1-like [Ipomoea batatas]
MTTLSEAYKEHPLSLEHIIPLDFQSLHKVPDSHLWPKITDNPNHHKQFASIPTVDLLAPNVVELIGHACETWGMFHVVNHGVSPSLVDEVEAQAYRLFTLPAHRKMKALRATPEMAEPFSGGHPIRRRFTAQLLPTLPKPYPCNRLSSSHRLSLPHNPPPEHRHRSPSLETRFPTVYHRAVVNESVHRVSVAYFYGPPVDSVVAPVVLRDGDGAPAYRTVRVKDYLSLKAMHLDKALSFIRL